MIKRNAYIGDGSMISIGDRSQIGINSELHGEIHIGNDVIMGPDVLFYLNQHDYSQIDIPINQQGMQENRPITIGNNVWIGARCIIMPGVSIGDNCIVGANTVVTKSFPANCIICGEAGKVVKMRNMDEYDLR